MIDEAALLACEQHVQTSPRDYANALKKMLDYKTKTEIAKAIGKTEAWIDKQLKHAETEFYWQLTGETWEFRITDSSALMMKMKKRSPGNLWECTCLHNSTTFQRETLEGAQKRAASWMAAVITNVLSDLERYNVR